MIRGLYKSVANFGLDFSNLSKSITTKASKNYKIEGDDPIDGYITSNDDAPHTVIMIHQWWGFNESITQTANIFSNKNIRVFVPDLYRGKLGSNPEEAGHHMENLNWDKAIEDIQQSKDHLVKSSKTISIVGFCMGGALALATPTKIKGFKAAGVFYGIPDLDHFKLEDLSKNGTKVIANFGRLDPLKGFSDAQSAQKLATNSKKHNYPIEVKIWEGATHAFCNQDGNQFNEDSRNKSFSLVRSLIQS